MTAPIVQFGTSRFLQAHVDLFVSDAMASGQDVGPITVVQTTGAAERAGRLAGFDGRPIPVIIRGIEDGKAVERTEYVTSIVRGLSAARDWAEVERVFVEDARFVVSNTGDSGYRMPEGEAISAGSAPEALSFPAKLTKLLLARFDAKQPPLTILPCELIGGNGTVLRDLCVGIAKRSGLPPSFAAWLEHDCVWANTLVDRIVSGSLEPAGAIAEPYALWAIERQPKLVVPCTHPAIVVTDDLREFERLKLFVLNLGHTVLAERWRIGNRAAGETVREILAAPEIRGFLDAIYDEEVIPVLEAAGIARAKTYRDTVIERFSNPFLDHKISDIFSSHASKKERRLGGLIALAAEVAPARKQPRLAAILASGVG